MNFGEVVGVIIGHGCLSGFGCDLLLCQLFGYLLRTVCQVFHKREHLGPLFAVERHSNGSFARAILKAVHCLGNSQHLVFWLHLAQVVKIYTECLNGLTDAFAVFVGNGHALSHAIHGPCNAFDGCAGCCCNSSECGQCGH